MAFGLGSAFVRVVAVLDRKQVEAESAKAGTAAGESYSTNFGSAVRSKAFLALGAVLGLATKGAVELDTAARNASASLGLAADEQGRFRSEVAALFKQNPTKGYAEIADTLAVLRQEWQLGEGDANKYAQSVLNFSKAARTDGVTAAKGLDDALDAFNLTAADSIALQDALIGAQKRGAGPAADSLRNLTAMAPALQAANLNWKDGVGLLIAFADAGVDAALAPRALQTALQKVQSPEELQALIEDIRNTTDDFERAGKAADLFGPRAGAKLAQAIKPGSDAFKQGSIDVAQFAGATTEAAKVVDESFANQITGAIRQVTGSLAELGAGAGPTLTAIAGIASLIQSAGGLTAAFNALKISAIAGWLATLGPVALLGGAGIAFIALVNQVNAVDNAQRDAAISAGDLTGAQAALKKQADDGSISWDEYDSKLDAVMSSQALQARTAALSAGATNEQADAAGKAAIANDRGATAAQLAALALVKEAAAANTTATATDASTTATGKGTVATGKFTDAQLAAADAAAKARGSVNGWLRPLGAAGAALTLVATEANTATDALNAIPRNIVITVAMRTIAATAGINNVEEKTSFPKDPLNAAEFFQNNLPTPKVKKSGGGGGKTETAAQVAAQAKLRDAALAVKAAFDTAFDSQHLKNQRAIDDTLNLAKTAHSAALDRIKDELAVQRAANAAPVTAAEQAQQQIEDARTLRDLQERLAEASDPRAQRDAAEALQSFQARQAIAVLRAQQEVADAAAEAAAGQATAVEDAKLAAAEAAAAKATAAEDKHYADQKAAFDAAYAKLQDDAEKSGHAITVKLAAGLLAGIPAVEAAAEKLAAAAGKYLPHSPAEKGPFSGSGAPYERGKATASEFGLGIARNLDGAMSALDAYRPTASSSYRPSVPGAAQAAAGMGGGGTGPTIIVNNPTPEPASQSVPDALRMIGAFG